MDEKTKEALERINTNIDIDQSNELKDKIEELIEEQEEYAENKKRYEEIKDSDDDTDLEEKADLEQDIKEYKSKATEREEKLNDIKTTVDMYIENAKRVMSWREQLN